MNTVTPLNAIVDEIFEMNELFTDVALGEGAALVFLLIGTILIGFSVAVFGYLTLGAAVNLVTPE